MAKADSIRRPHNFKDLTGKVFGETWVVVRLIEKTATSKSKWLCKCSCGNERAMGASEISGNKTQRCRACTAKITFTTHGMARSREYKSWDAMLGRCYRTTDSEYRNYGERGIAVCDRWRNSFEAFLEDMGPRPIKTTLDRYPDNDGSYEPNNCRWATPTEQGRNTRANRLVEFDGRTQCMSAWAEESGMSIQALYQRLKRGWSIERALTEPVKGKP